MRLSFSRDGSQASGYVCSICKQICPSCLFSLLFNWHRFIFHLLAHFRWAKAVGAEAEGAKVEKETNYNMICKQWHSTLLLSIVRMNGLLRAVSSRKKETADREEPENTYERFQFHFNLHTHSNSKRMMLVASAWLCTGTPMIAWACITGCPSIHRQQWCQKENREPQKNVCANIERRAKWYVSPQDRRHEITFRRNGIEPIVSTKQTIRFGSNGFTFINITASNASNAQTSQLYYLTPWVFSWKSDLD